MERDEPIRDPLVIRLYTLADCDCCAIYSKSRASFNSQDFLIFFSFGQFGLNEYGWNVLSWNGWDPRQMHKKTKWLQDVKDSQIPLDNSFGIYFIIYVQPNFHTSEIVI